MTDTERKALCDMLMARATELMAGEIGAPIAMMLDTMVTYTAAHACAHLGSPGAAKAFRIAAGKIDAGLFHSVTGEILPGESRH